MSETAVNGVEPIIFLDDVHVTFRTRTGSILHPNLVHAVQGVTIKLMPGQTIGIVGESGCGKSTTANVMCGLQAPTSGKVYFKARTSPSVLPRIVVTWAASSRSCSRTPRRHSTLAWSFASSCSTPCASTTWVPSRAGEAR